MFDIESASSLAADENIISLRGSKLIKIERIFNCFKNRRKFEIQYY